MKLKPIQRQSINTLVGLLPKPAMYLSGFCGWKEPSETANVMGEEWQLDFVATCSDGYYASYRYPERHDFALAT